jgi:hypothetical protein
MEIIKKLIEERAFKVKKRPRKKAFLIFGFEKK